MIWRLTLDFKDILIDSLIFFNFAIAIRTFFQKIGHPQDIAPSMAMGFTINHIGAVLFPVIGGVLWMVDYRIPFVTGAALSVISLVAVQFISREIRKHGADIPVDPATVRTPLK